MIAIAMIIAPMKLVIMELAIAMMIEMAVLMKVTVMDMKATRVPMETISAASMKLVSVATMIPAMGTAMGTMTGTMMVIRRALQI